LSINRRKFLGAAAVTPIAARSAINEMSEPEFGAKMDHPTPNPLSGSPIYEDTAVSIEPHADYLRKRHLGIKAAKEMLGGRVPKHAMERLNNNYLGQFHHWSDIDALKSISPVMRHRIKAHRQRERAIREYWDRQEDMIDSVEGLLEREMLSNLGFRENY